MGVVGVSHQPAAPSGYSLGDSIISVLGENLLLCTMGEGKEQAEDSHIGLPSHPGVKWAVYQHDLLSPA